MRVILFTILLIALMSVSVFSQKQKNKDESVIPNLTGVWTFDLEKSLSPNREIDTEEKKSYTDYVLTITQTNSEVKIVKSFIFKGKESKYTISLFTDKRGEQNVGSYQKHNIINDYKDLIVWLEDVNIKSESFWKKGKLIRNGSFSGNIGIRPSFKVQARHMIKETYTLSNDAKTLTVETDLHILKSAENIGFWTSKQVFRKRDI